MNEAREVIARYFGETANLCEDWPANWPEGCAVEHKKCVCLQDAENIIARLAAANIEVCPGWEGEQWKAVPDWEDNYQVSNYGRIRRMDGTVLQSWLRKDGYELVRFSVAPRRFGMRVHRAVASAFIPNPGNKPNVNHIDSRPWNNRVENLEWCTQAENLAHAEQAGRLRRDQWSGQRGPTARLSEQQVAEVRAEYARGGKSYRVLAKKYGMGKSSIGRVINGHSYSYLPSPPESME